MSTSVFIIRVKVFILMYNVFSVAIVLIVMERRDNSSILSMSEQWCFREQLEGMYKTTKSDEWSMIVAGTLAHVNHIPAANAFYHYQCRSSFWTGGMGGGGQMPIRHVQVEAGIYQQRKPIIGRPELEIKISLLRETLSHYLLQILLSHCKEILSASA